MASMKITDALAKHLRQLQANGRSINTVRQRERQVRSLCDWLRVQGIDLQLGDITPEILADFLCSPQVLQRLDGKDKQTGSVNSVRSNIRTFFRFAVDAGWIERNPARLIQLANCAPPPPRGLTEDEQERLLAAFRGVEGLHVLRDRALFTMLLRTGLRTGSALALDVGDVDLEAGEITARRVKGGRGQVVFLGRDVATVLRDHIGDRVEGPLFGSGSGQRLSSRQVQRRLGMWLGRACVRRVGPHALRHTFAQALYSQTRDILLVRQALGHRSISSTLTYASASQDELRWAITKIPASDSEEKSSRHCRG